jgi:hypothetical protein
LEIIQQVREMLTAQATIKKYRVSEPDWTRERKLTFSRVAALILRGHKLSQQTAVNRLFQELGEVESVATNSAYSQARQKLKPELFRDLNAMIVGSFYRLYDEAHGLQLWHGRRLVGVDGSYLNLPDTEELREQFSVQVNKDGERVQALSSICYDLLNDVALSAGLGKKQAEKNFLQSTHLSMLKTGDVVVMDRLYADYVVMVWLLRQDLDFVIRFPQAGFTEIIEFWQSGEAEREVRLKCPDSDGVRRLRREQPLPASLRIRLIRVELEEGEIEVLGTSLRDKAQYPRAEFKQVYGWRWNEETWLRRLKSIFEVERFSGTSSVAIEQDFYGMIFLASLESILSKSDEAELQRQTERQQRKYAVQVNHAVSYLALVDHTVTLLLDEERSIERTLEDLHRLFRTTPTPIRPGRKFPRDQTTKADSLYYQRYKKKLLT